jgi:hypothetical protein
MSRRTGNGTWLDVSALPPHLQPALYGGQRVAEDLDDLPAIDATVHGVQHLQPEFVGVAFMPASIRKAQPKCNPPLGGTVGGSAILAKSLRTPPQVHLTKKQSIEVGIMVEPSRPSSLLVSKSTLRWYRTPLGKLARLGLLLAEKIP